MKKIWDRDMGRGEFLRFGLATAGWMLLGGMGAPGVAAGQQGGKSGGGTGSGTVKVYSVEKRGYIVADRVVKSDAEWEKILTPDQYQVFPPWTDSLFWGYTFSWLYCGGIWPGFGT